MTRRSILTAAALAIVRIALATRPPLPITRPRSSSATRDLVDEVAVLFQLLDLHGLRILDQRPGEESSSSVIGISCRWP